MYHFGTLLLLLLRSSIDRRYEKELMIGDRCTETTEDRSIAIIVI